jgi:hypothetical protein
MIWEPEARPERPAELPEPPAQLPEPDVAPDVMKSQVVIAAGAEGARLELLERHLKAVTARVNALAQMEHARQQAPSAEGGGTDEASLTDLQASMDRVLAEARAEVASVSETGAASITALEEQARQVMTRLAELVDRQREELSAVEAMVHTARSETERLSEANQELARDHAELHQRLVEAGQPPESAAAQLDLVKVEELITARVADVEGRLVDLVDGQRAELEALIGASLPPDPTAYLDAMEARLTTAEAILHEQHSQHAAALDQLVEAQRAELEEALDLRVRHELGGVATVVEGLTRARDQLAREVDRLVQQVVDAEVKIDGLAATSDTSASRLHSLEQHMEASLHHLTDQVRALRRRLEAPVLDQGLATAAMSAEPRHDASAGTPGNGTLVDALERQLQAAESRLSRLAVPFGDDPD